MRDGELAPFGSNGEIVEVDETFIGKDPNIPVRKGFEHKHKVLSLVNRNTGQAKSMVVDNLKASTIVSILLENIVREAEVMTDDARQYHWLKYLFSGHGCVKHTQGEYVSLDNPKIHTNTVEGFFSIFKRGMKGVYQHCKKQHLHRYLAEFDLRYNNRSALGYDDAERAENLLKGVSGKRLTYQTTNQQMR
jgi:transposase-like protein